MARQQACPYPDDITNCICRKHMTLVNCNGKHLTSIPKIPDSAVEVNLNNNNLTTIPNHAFSGLSRLRKLYLEFNNIQTILPFAFRGLISLRYLYLSENKISVLGNKSFASIPKLKNLELKHNKIHKISKNAFDGTFAIASINIRQNYLLAVPSFGYQSNLTYIDMFDNLIVNATFPTSFMDNLQKLSVNLGKNSIQTIKKFTFASLANKRILELNLGQNKIRTVEKNAFAAFQSVSSLTLNKNRLNTLSLKNMSVDLKGKSLKSLDLSDNSLTLSAIYFSLSRIVNATLKILRLRSNNISALMARRFSTFKELTELDMSRNRITYIFENAFEGLDKLSSLKLDNNYVMSVPKDMPTTLKRFYLNKNAIKELESNAFKKLFKLKELSLKQNNIFSLSSGSFNDLGNLEKLDMSNNNIFYLPGSIFSPLKRLIHLDLGKNKLHSIQHLPNVFEPLTSLRFLSLQDNKYSFFHETTFLTTVSLQTLRLEVNNLGDFFAEENGRKLFRGLTNLEILSIANNNIKTLHESLFKDQLSLKELHAEHNMLSLWGQNTFRSTKNLTVLDMSFNLIHGIEETNLHYLNDLRYLSLAGNPFICNCNLLWFREWINTTTTVLPNIDSYTCHGPKEWHPKPLLQFSRSKIDCTNHTEDKNVIIGAAFAGLLVSVCVCVLGYKVRWRIRLRLYLISKRGKRFIRDFKMVNRMRNYGAIGNHQELFDAYISCSDQDKPWVLRHLFPGIDNGQLNDENRFGGSFKLYFDERDSEAGNLVISQL